MRLEAVNFHALLLRNALFDQELGDLSSLIALKLHYRSQIRIIDDRSVAAKALFKSFQNILEVKLWMQPSHCRQALAPVALLDSDMDVSCLKSVVTLRFRKRVKSLEIRES
eukprot:EC120426.1.p1 GENE.EC120426.1~~EC120426.1.p1  ORF type:complete len:111 (-),score=17.19 EC120426.1:173-505(-)